MNNECDYREDSRCSLENCVDQNYLTCKRFQQLRDQDICIAAQKAEDEGWARRFIEKREILEPLKKEEIELFRSLAKEHDIPYYSILAYLLEPALELTPAS